MHLLLTDRLTCPRCGPPFGLILRADRLEERDVLEGVLGCPNCRDSYPIEEGFGDLRAPPRRDLPPGLAGTPEARDGDEQAAERMRALLGVAQGPGTVGLMGEPARHAAVLADTIEDVHVVGIDADLRGWPPARGVSRLVAAPGIPIFDRSLRAVGIDGRLGTDALADAARVVARMGRVVVTRAAGDAPTILELAGIEVLAVEAGTVVAARR